MDCILKASASVLNSGSGTQEGCQKWFGDRTADVPHPLLKLCLQPCFKKDKLKDLQAWVEDVEKRPGSSSETKAFQYGEKKTAKWEWS